MSSGKGSARSNSLAGLQEVGPELDWLFESPFFNGSNSVHIRRQ